MKIYPQGSLALAFLTLTALLPRATVVALKPTGVHAPQAGTSKPVSYPDRNGKESILYAESHALVIGVSEYQNPLWPRLKSVPDDVREVSSVLAERGFKVEPPVVNPTREMLRKAINDFVDRYGLDEMNRLLIYFAGHGATITSPDGRRRGLIIPSDALACPRPEERETPDYDARAKECVRGAVTMDEIEAHARNIQARHALFIFDSCFSGSVFDAVTMDVEIDVAAPDVNIPVPDDMRHPVRVFMSSGSAEQRVLADSRFRTLFVDALRGKQGELAKDGYITATELGYYLRRNVWRLTSGMQTPQVGKINDIKLSRGDFIFTLPRPAGTPSAIAAVRSRPMLFVPPRRQGEVEASIFSLDQRYILTGGADHTAYLWDVVRGQEAIRFKGHRSQIKAVAISPDSRSSLTGGADGRAVIWDNNSGAQRQTIEQASAVTAAAFSKDGRRILIGGADGKAQLYEEREMAETGASSSGYWKITVKKFVEAGVFGGHAGEINSVAFSEDGRLVLTASSDGTARLWDEARNKQVSRLGDAGNPIFAAAFSSDGKLILTAGSDPLAPLRLWETTGRPSGVNFEIEGPVMSAAFSPDGRRIAASSGRDVYLWDKDGANKVVLQGHTDRVTSVGFSPDGKLLLTASNDNSVRLWEIYAARELCRMISFPNDTWAVIDPDGRFDTNELEENHSLRWTAPGYNSSLPLEIFVRHYYEPRLLPRSIAGESLPPTDSLANLNRAQPRVSITKVRRREGDPDRVDVMVEVGVGHSEVTRDGTKVRQESGVYDLRLFRDGQLVAWSADLQTLGTGRQTPEEKKQGGETGAPGQGATAPPVAAGAISEELRLWRQATQVELREDGRQVITFNDVRLPRRPDVSRVEFSAYAFNSDRVKGMTHRFAYDLPKDRRPVTPRAYLINIGVNEYEGLPSYRLLFAAQDAWEIQRVIAEQLSNVGEYEVIPVLLTAGVTPGQGDVSAHVGRSATKANIKAVFNLLSNRQVSSEVLRAIPNSDKIRGATPDDLIIISMSSHGFTDNKGVFYLMPYDIGPRTTPAVSPSDALKARSISSDELTEWLRDVDAGEIAMILDACFSAAAVGQERAKFGPMGSRGLGQLAYDKGMRILASSQAKEPSYELPKLRHGVLTYAIAVEGLRGEKADFRPPRGEITLTELFAYSVERVPELYELMRGANVKKPTQRGGEITLSGELADVRKASLQRPALFDFARRNKKEVVLMRTKERSP